MPAPPARRTRDALVEEGVHALLELTPAALLSAVGAKQIARRAGVGVTTLYHHFGSLDAFAEAVVARVFDPGKFAVDAVTDQVKRVRASWLPGEAGRAMHLAEFARVRDDDELRVRHGLWALGGSAMDAAYGNMLRIVNARIGAFAHALFADWGRELSPPFDMAAYVAAQGALLSGSVVHHLVDPDALDAERFARTALALTTVMLRVQGDRRTLDDRLTEINYYPLHATKGVALTDVRLRTRGRLLATAAELFGRQGYEQTTLPQIANSAGVSTSTAYALFDNVTDIATQLLLKQAEDLFAVQRWSAPRGVAQVVERLTAVAQFLAARSGHARPYAAGLITGATPAQDVILYTVRSGLEDAGEHGALRDGLDLDEAARGLLLVLCGQLLGGLENGAAGAVRRVTKLLLTGVLADPRAFAAGGWS